MNNFWLKMDSRPKLQSVAAVYDRRCRDSDLLKRSSSRACRGTSNYFVSLPFLAILLFWSIDLPLRAQVADPGVAQSLDKVTLHVGKATLNTEIAATPQQQEIGLMYRSHMADNDGMIFLLPLGTATFWMKNTLIPLSVAFIDKNGVILEIHDMKAMDTTITRSDSNQVAYALEANLHWFSLNGIKPGDKLDPAPATLTKSSP